MLDSRSNLTFHHFGQGSHRNLLKTSLFFDLVEFSNDMSQDRGGSNKIAGNKMREVSGEVMVTCVTVAKEGGGG